MTHELIKRIETASSRCRRESTRIDWYHLVVTRWPLVDPGHTHRPLLITSLLSADTRTRTRVMYHKSFEFARNFAELSRVRARTRGRISLPQSGTRNRTKSADGGFLSRPLLFTMPLFSTFVTTRSSSFLACVLPQSGACNRALFLSSPQSSLLASLALPIRIHFLLILALASLALLLSLTRLSFSLAFLRPRLSRPFSRCRLDGPVGPGTA